MKLKHIASVFLLIFIIYELMEFYVIYSVEPVFIEVSRVYGETEENTLLGIRIYFPNPYFLSVRVYSFKLKLNCPGLSGGEGQAFNLTLTPRFTNIFSLNASVSGGLGSKCEVIYSWVPDPFILYLLNLHPLNFTRRTDLVMPGKSPFLWAGWNETETSIGECVSLQVYTYPSSVFNVRVFADYLSMPPVAVFEKSGVGGGTFIFCPKEPSSLRLKGYFLEVVSGDARWVQADSYPPRLKVSP